MSGRDYGPFWPGPARTVPFFRALRARIAATVALLAGGLAWIVLFLAFLAGRFAWYQDLAVVLASLVVVPAVVVAMWVSFGLTAARRFRRAWWGDHYL